MDTASPHRRYPKKNRVCRQVDFAESKKGRRHRFSAIVLTRYRRTAPPDGAIHELRLGIVIAKRICRRAHERNRLRRLIKEFFRLRLLPQALTLGLSQEDWIVVAQTGINEVKLIADLNHTLLMSGSTPSR